MTPRLVLRLPAVSLGTKLEPLDDELNTDRAVVMPVKLMYMTTGSVSGFDSYGKKEGLEGIRER